MEGTFTASSLLVNQVGSAGRAEQPNAVAPVQACPNKNYIDLQYLYCSKAPVAGAEFWITDTSGQNLLAKGTLDANGQARVGNLPDDATDVNIYYSGDPQPFSLFEQFKPKANPEYRETAPAREESLFDVAVKNIAQAMLLYQQLNQAAGEWVLGAIAGDWSEDQTLGQILFDTVVSLIPVVDQVADGRDIAANIYQLVWKKKYDEFGPWFSLVATVIGCIPEVGTAIKGTAKSLVKVGKEGASLLKKSGINLGGLIRFLNTLGEGNVLRWLRALADNFHHYGKIVGDKICEILLRLESKILEIKGRVVKKAEEFLQVILDNIKEVLKRVGKMVTEIISFIKKELEELLLQIKDYVYKGKTRKKNGVRQLDDPAAKMVRKKWLETVAKHAGMQPSDVENLLKHCEESGEIIIVRFTNGDSIKFQGKAKHLPKPLPVKLKTAKPPSPHAGLVVKPDPAKRGGKPVEDWEAQNVRELEEAGYKFDKDGILHDADGNRFYGDYDLQSVHQGGITDLDTGKEINMVKVTNPKDSDAVKRINEGMRPNQNKMTGRQEQIQHGAEADFHVKKGADGKPLLDENGHMIPATEEEILSGKSTLGRQFGDDEQYIVIKPDGVQMLDDPSELRQIYRENDIPWQYDVSEPLSAAEIAAKKAQTATAK